MSHRNERIKQRLIGAHLHPQSRQVKQAKRNMRHNLKVQQSKDGQKHQQNQTAGKFNWFKVQVSQFRQVDPRLLPTEDETRAMLKLLKKPKKKRDTNYIEKHSDSEDSGLASELDDDEDDEDAVPMDAGSNDAEVEADDEQQDQQQQQQQVMPQGDIVFPEPLNQQEVRTLAYYYTQRHNEELAELQSRRNPPNGAIKRLKGLKEQEEKELRNGMEVPNLTDGSGVASLLSWDGYDRTVTSVQRAKISFSGDPAKDLLPFNPLDILEVKMARPGASYQEEVKEQAARRNTKLTAGGKEKIGGEAAKLVSNKVGAKFVSTDEVIQAGRKRRAAKNQVETKRRFHQAIARSRML